jgi:outer membrane protein assembly factor BamB
MFIKTVLAALLTLSCGQAFAEAVANWPRWRGPQDNGSIEKGDFAVKFDAQTNLAWKTPLPGKGCSTPIVWNERIYLTAPVDKQDALLAFDLSGKQLWQAPLGAERAGKHRNGSGSNPSPATDGKAIYVYFKSGNLAAIDFDGKVLWKTNLVERFGRDTLYWDYGTSPVLSEKLVIVTMMHQGESYIAAFDKASGELRYKTARNYTTPVEGDHSYATPILIQHDGKEALLIWGAQHLTAHDIADGKVLWSCGDFNPAAKPNWVAVSSHLVAGDIAVVPFGRGSRLDGVKLGGSGDVTKSHRLWTREDTGSFVPTPSALKDRIYLLRDRGEIECVEAATGKTLWKGELPKSGPSYYASPLLAGGKIYAPREDGVIYVARADGQFEVLAENKMNERIIASPVPLGNRLLIRGEQHLFCIAAP